jgi:hypothetical protein
LRPTFGSGQVCLPLLATMIALVAVIEEPMIRAPAEMSAIAIVWSEPPPDAWVITTGVIGTVLPASVIVTVLTTGFVPAGNVTVLVSVRVGKIVLDGVGALTCLSSSFSAARPYSKTMHPAIPRARVIDALALVLAPRHQRSMLGNDSPVLPISGGWRRER